MYWAIPPPYPPSSTKLTALILFHFLLSISISNLYVINNIKETRHSQNTILYVFLYIFWYKRTTHTSFTYSRELACFLANKIKINLYLNSSLIWIKRSILLVCVMLYMYCVCASHVQYLFILLVQYPLEMLCEIWRNGFSSIRYNSTWNFRVLWKLHQSTMELFDTVIVPTTFPKLDQNTR